MTTRLQTLNKESVCLSASLTASVCGTCARRTRRRGVEWMREEDELTAERRRVVQYTKDAATAAASLANKDTTDVQAPHRQT